MKWTIKGTPNTQKEKEEYDLQKAYSKFAEARWTTQEGKTNEDGNYTGTFTCKQLNKFLNTYYSNLKINEKLEYNDYMTLKIENQKATVTVNYPGTYFTCHESDKWKAAIINSNIQKAIDNYFVDLFGIF